MRTTDREFLLDFIACCATITAYVIEIVVRKVYHGDLIISIVESIPVLLFIFCWLTLLLIRWYGINSIGSYSQILSWILFILVLLTFYFNKAIQLMGYKLLFFATFLFILFSSYLIIKSKYNLWIRARRIIATVPALIILMPIFVGYWLDEPRMWLGSPSRNQQTPVATLVILFDEMNAKSSNGIQKVLSDRGLKVEFKAILPIHNSTVEAVAAIFTGQNFKGARACGFSRVCGNGIALDFSTVFVERNDVDIVGFYHPYCAIQGLRSCYRATLNRSIWDYDRLVCSFKKRMGLNTDGDNKLCQLVTKQDWINMQQSVVNKILEAPVLKEGGVLFAHIPLPHPPSNGTGTLSEQYSRNLELSEQLLGQFLDRLVLSRVEPRILIFSDHPLRPSLWCANEAVSFDLPCEIEPDLVDNFVPLILASQEKIPNFNNVKSNIEIFNILREWIN